MSALLEERARVDWRTTGGPCGRAFSQRWLTCALTVCALTAFPVRAQQATALQPFGSGAPGATKAATPPSPSSQHEAAQQPGQDAQVHAYTSSGFTVGRTTVKVHFIQVLTKPLGNTARDDVYGALGMDVLDQLKSDTFDYRTMRFAVKPQ